jgi:hypothetical protein
MIRHVILLDLLEEPERRNHLRRIVSQVDPVSQIVVLGSVFPTVGPIDERHWCRFHLQRRIGEWSSELPAVQVRPEIGSGSNLAGEVSLVMVDL